MQTIAAPVAPSSSVSSAITGGAEDIAYRRPTEFRVNHEFRQHVSHLLSPQDRGAIHRYIQSLSSQISRFLFFDETEKEGIRSVYHFEPEENFVLQGDKAKATIDVIKMQCYDRVPFDLGVILCIPHLFVEHCLVMQGVKLAPDAKGNYCETSSYEGFNDSDATYELDRQACTMLNLHPRGGMMVFYHPETVGATQAGLRVLAPEQFLTLPEDTNFGLIHHETRPFAHCITESIFEGYRGSTDRRIADIVTNASNDYYARLTLMITLSEI